MKLVVYCTCATGSGHGGSGSGGGADDANDEADDANDEAAAVGDGTGDVTCKGCVMLAAVTEEAGSKAAKQPSVRILQRCNAFFA